MSFDSPQARLGNLLFRDPRFSTASGDLPASCSSCHLFDEDPQGIRAFADFFNRSWISYRTQSPTRFELRNSPSLFDVAQMPRLHFDGEFASLEDLVKGTFGGRPMGWLPDEQEKAYAQIYAVVVNDPNYREQFKKAYDVEIEKLDQAEVVNQVARAVADFMRTLKSPMNSPYDQFIKNNGLEIAPKENENVQAFGNRLLTKISELEKNKTLKLTGNFSSQALSGLKIFFDSATGNCVACHAPPLFSDFSYHNLGISQVDYDQVHGEGKFVLLEIPDASNAIRPAANFRQFPNGKNPSDVDLGYWNFANLKTSTVRRADETDSQFLQRMIGTMKTPGLRHLAYSYPYMHNGAYHSVAETLREISRLSDLARAEKIRAADPELKKIHLRDSDIISLAAFLKTLNEDLKAGKRE